VTPNACSTTWQFKVNNGNNKVTFTNPAAQPGVNSFSVCQVITSDHSLFPGQWQDYSGTFTYGSDSTGWDLFGNNVTNNECRFGVSDGTHSVITNGVTLTSGTTHLCCAVLVHAGAATTYIDGGVGVSTSAASVGNITNTLPLVLMGDHQVSGTGGAGPQGAFYYWNVALTATEMGLINTAITTYGFVTHFSTSAGGSAGIVRDPVFAWLPGNPYINSMTPVSLSNLTLSGIATITYDPVPSTPYCGSVNNGVNAGCLPAQQFDGGQVFDFGTTVGDPGSGTVSPTNDFTICAVQEGSGLAIPESVDKYTSSVGYELGMNGLNSGSFSDCEVESGISVGGTGPSGIAYNDWTVCCEAFQANDGASAQHSCPYQNGVLGSSPDGYQICDNSGLASQHNTVHFGIGGPVGGAFVSMWKGKIQSVWYWNAKLTTAQLAAFAAPFLSSSNSASPYCQFVSDWNCYSSGM